MASPLTKRNPALWHWFGELKSAWLGLARIHHPVIIGWLGNRLESIDVFGFSDKIGIPRRKSPVRSFFVALGQLFKWRPFSAVGVGILGNDLQWLWLQPPSFCLKDVLKKTRFKYLVSPDIQNDSHLRGDLGLDEKGIPALSSHGQARTALNGKPIKPTLYPTLLRSGATWFIVRSNAHSIIHSLESACCRQDPLYTAPSLGTSSNMAEARIRSLTEVSVRHLRSLKGFNSSIGAVYYFFI